MEETQKEERLVSAIGQIMFTSIKCEDDVHCDQDKNCWSAESSLSLGLSATYHVTHRYTALTDQLQRLVDQDVSTVHEYDEFVKCMRIRTIMMFADL